MNFPVQQQGWGFGLGHSSAPFNLQYEQWLAGVDQAFNSLTPTLLRSAHEHRAIYGSSSEATLANLLAPISFSAAGNFRIRGHNGNAMGLSLQIYFVGPPLSGKSEARTRFMRPIHEGMKGFDHPWIHGNTTPPALVREIRRGGNYAMFSVEEGRGFWKSQLSKEFDLWSQLYAGNVPDFSRSNDRDLGIQVPKGVVLVQCINTQEVFFAPYVQRYGKEAIGSGDANRKLIFQSDELATPGSGGQQAESALLLYDMRIIEDLSAARQKRALLAEDRLPIIEVSFQAEQVLRAAIEKFRRIAEARMESREAAAFAIRLATNVRRIGGCMHSFERYQGELSAETMTRSVIIGELAASGWLRALLPMPVTSQEHIDACILEHYLRRSHPIVRRSDLIAVAPNFNWTENRMRSAIQALCGSGRALSVPRIERGRRRVTIELQGTHPLLLGNL